MTSSGNAERFPVWPAMLGVLVVMALVVASGWWWRRSSVETSAVVSPPAPRKIVGEAIKPEPPSEDYVGSAACAKCHAAIAESYAAHPMYRSAGSTPGDDDVENFAEGTEFKFDDGRIYRVEKTPDGIYHHEMLLDKEGELVYDEAAKISLFIGSGARGKSYAIDRDGLLFQSPISWYTSDQKWDISPGYSYRHKRFGRRIPGECVLCHAGRPTHDASRNNYFPEPVLIEAAIGCERCHGPGQKHIELHESTELAKSDEAIINPARLDPDRREAVCYQCHLIGKSRFTRYGRTFDDFRPGDRLEDVWATMVAGSSVRGDRKTKAVSHVEQTRESACFIKSEGRFGCVSCHDPHSTPAKTDAALYYRQRCLECHAEKGCTLPAEQQAASPANNSCTYCHMPQLSAHDIAHASQTDHRILRRFDEDDANPYPGGESDKLVIFDQENLVMPEWELERILALSKTRKLQETGYASQAVADELQQTLTMITDIAPDDYMSLSAQAAVADLRQDHATARKLWEHVLELRPTDEQILEFLAGVCQKTGDYQAGLEYFDRLIALNPNRVSDHLHRAMLLSEFGRWLEAIDDAETAVKIDPLDKSARRWLRDAYQRTGNLEASRRHDSILKRISALPVPPG